MIKELEPKRVFEIFEEIDKIPRGSGNEKAVSDHLYLQAESLGLKVVQDNLNNIVISKPASPGYEKAQTVMLQAHLDMVCEKIPESKHDFEKDPIGLKVDGDWIVSDCGTSIGADNGIGVAYAMAILEDNHLKHPPLEVVFTTCEESTFDGAMGLSEKLFTAKRMINLDYCADNEILAGSCGGTGINFSFRVEHETVAPEDSVLRITVKGMEGGHSGEDIHRGRGNAIEVLLRLIDEDYVRLADFDGGSFRLAIPREAKCCVVIPKSREGAFCDKVYKVSQEIYKEYAVSAPNLVIRMAPDRATKKLTESCQSRVLIACRLFPNGIMQMNGAAEGLVESSVNMGTCQLKDDTFLITAEARGSYNSTVDDIRRKTDLLAGVTGGKAEYFGAYVPWEFKEDSQLREHAVRCYSELYGEEPRTVVAHAGIESAMFIEKEPEMDAISIGPNCEYFHSPNERASISSIKKVWDFLLTLLENLK